MKNSISFFAIIIFSVIQSQELKDFIVPKNYEKILESKGDLDKDGTDETVVVFNTDKKIESETESAGLERKLYILKTINGQVKIWKENSNLIFQSEMGFYPSDNKLELSIKNNCLYILQSYYTNSRHSETCKYTFRFQNGDFYLIGASIRFDDTCEFNFKNEVNFSTGKVIIDNQFSDCDEGSDRKIPKDYYKEFTHKFPKLIKMNDFRIGENKINIPNSKQHFNY